MATARWSRNDCSICLEPFRGRNPKFLPCYHTFCVQCLNQLADRAREESRTVLWRVGGGISITCPSCRKTTPVPPDGIESLQTNFYIDDTIYCDLCDEGHGAEFACSNCPSKFCRGCRRVHEEICDWPVVCAINDSASDGSSSAGDLAAKVKVVSAKVQRLEKLTEVTPLLIRDLNAAQNISSKIRSDVSSLQASFTAHLDANQLLRSDFNEQMEELQQSLSEVRNSLQNPQCSHTGFGRRFTQHANNKLERRHEGLQASLNTLREDHNKLRSQVQEHVGPNYQRNWDLMSNSEVDVSDHGKLNRQINNVFFCTVMIVGLLVFACVVNGMVLANRPVDK